MCFVEKFRIVTEDSKNEGMSAALLGKDSRLIDFQRLEKPVHEALVDDLLSLKLRAKRHGFNLQLASGYRDFDQQLQIWNAKARGLRPVLDTDEAPIEIQKLANKDRVFAILRWTALPGSSRHHWGTDFDVFDAHAIGGNYQLQLTRAETEAGGPFESFYIWLTCELNSQSSPFFRPYIKDHGGVSPEPWHLSFRPLAEEFERQRTINQLRACIEGSDIELKQEILLHLEEIYRRFIVPTDNY